MTTTTQAPRLCDRCGRILSGENGHRAQHPDRRKLLFCSGCLREHRPALEKQHWTIGPLDTPDPVAGPRKPVRCGRCGQGCSGRQVTVSPESVPVTVVHCPRCDTRTCNYVVGKDFRGDPVKCDSLALGREDPLCPKGHPLMPEAS